MRWAADGGSCSTGTRTEEVVLADVSPESKNGSDL